MGFHALPNKFVASIDLNVSNMEVVSQFYNHVLGFSLLSESPEKTELTVDGKTPMITLHKTGKSPDRRTAGLYHIAVLLPERALLGSFLAHMARLGYPLTGGSDHGVSEAIYLNDPEGNGIEIYADRSPGRWNWQGRQVEMYTEPLDAHGLIEEGRLLQWEGMPVGTVLGHIHLSVSDIAKSNSFYAGLLGYDVVCSYGDKALFLSTGQYHHHIAVNSWAGNRLEPPMEGEPGLAFYTVVLDGVRELDVVKDRFKKEGIPFKDKGNVLEVKDPSGIRLCLAAV